MATVIPGARSLAEPLPASVVTLGSFDGVHRGHQTLIRRAVESARASGVVSVGYTFHPHPAAIVAPKRVPATLMSIEERAHTMGRYGLDYVLVEPFNADFARVTAEEFVRAFLVERLQPQRVVVGFNFTYGRGRSGDVDHLRAMGDRFGFAVDVVEAVAIEREVVSSTAIRAYLRDGDVSAARRLLGRDPTMTGRVVPGDQRGRALGFPTANVASDATLVPAHGVYACRVEILNDDGATESVHDAVANIGRRPTFGGEAVAVEAFLLDFAGDLYGRRLRVALVAHLRAERKFDGIDALRDQLARDVEAARASLAARSAQDGP